jgi:hypothetical protein
MSLLIGAILTVALGVLVVLAILAYLAHRRYRTLSMKAIGVGFTAVVVTAVWFDR